IIVGNKSEQVGTGKAFRLSLVYVLAMALTYTVAGVIIGLTGENIQATLQHPYVLTAFALLFVVLSASMFGLFELQMPAFIQNRLMAASNQQKSGSYVGVAGMGLLSALIVGPCVTAPLVGALIYIGQTGDAVLGGAALLALSMGMGLPVLIIGTSFGKYLPTAGPWMDNIKAAFGFMLLGVAIWMLDRVIPSWATMLLAAMLLIMIGMFLGVFDGKAGSGLQKIGKGLGYASVVYGTLLLIGVGTGTGSLIRPLQGLAASGGAAGGIASVEHVTFNRIKGVPELEAALNTARSQNKPVILDFYADWCVSCKEMEAFTFTNQQVAAQMSKAVLLQADVTANDKADKELLRHYGIFGPPAIIFYNNEGAEVEGSRVVGFMSADKFLTHLSLVL
ncbi:MAG: protein-disulfide reductase DsbD, partial [Pseudomonadota bacterium]